MKKCILPLLMAVWMLQGCADRETQTAAVSESSIAAIEEEHSEGA